MYREKEIVRIAARENNKKRSYLVVNRLQGKHIPASPKEIINMFDSLADEIRDRFDADKTLIIGFAETATAIGSRLAVKLGTAYMQTTRENIPGAEYLDFTESHSHASQQRIVKQGLDVVIDRITDIVFAEDELTTGNTILKAKSAVETAFPEKKLRFSAVSLLNGMDGDAVENYRRNNVGLYYLVKTDHSKYPQAAEAFVCDGDYFPAETEVSDAVSYEINGALNPRIITDGKKYGSACDNLADKIISLSGKINGNVLVLGTEECMYPAIRLAYRLEKSGCDVRTHSTTRSPISVSTDKSYPLHKRFELRSLYDSERLTYIYDIGKYERVIILTDALSSDDIGVRTLLTALRKAGNRNIEMVRWIK